LIPNDFKSKSQPIALLILPNITDFRWSPRIILESGPKKFLYLWPPPNVQSMATLLLITTAEWAEYHASIKLHITLHMIAIKTSALNTCVIHNSLIKRLSTVGFLHGKHIVQLHRHTRIGRQLYTQTRIGLQLYTTVNYTMFIYFGNATNKHTVQNLENICITIGGRISSSTVQTILLYLVI